MKPTVICMYRLSYLCCVTVNFIVYIMYYASCI